MIYHFGLSLLLFSLSQVAYAKCTDGPTSFCNVSLLSVYDGDTIKVDLPNTHPLLGKSLGVRIKGINTPETSTKNACEKRLGAQAKSYSANLIGKAKAIHLTDCGRDKYFRILCQVWADDISVGPELLKMKIAYEYYGDKKPNIDWCAQERMPASKFK